MTVTVHAPPPPSIVINNPNTTTYHNTQRPTPPTSPIRSRATPPRVSTPPTATLISRSIPKSCYLCDEQNPGDFSPTTKFLEDCLLCNRQFCPVHKAFQQELQHQYDISICNINHSLYYHECLEEARKVVTSSTGDRQGTPRDEIEKEAAEMLVVDGVFPSVGEREKTLFMRSPVSASTLKQLAEIRSLDAELSGTKGWRPSALIETKSFIGADIAV